MLLTLKQDVPSYLRNKEELCSTSDVSIVLQDQSVLGAHRCFLSFASPVLREVMMSVDLRQEEEVFILLEGFKKDTVVSFLQFIYNGLLGLVFLLQIFFLKLSKFQLSTTRRSQT